MRKLYKHGKEYNIWGIDCDLQDFADDEVERALANGWVLSPLDLKQDAEKPIVSRIEPVKRGRGRPPKHGT